MAQGGARAAAACATAAELAWRLERLCEVGAVARDLGWCLGRLDGGDLVWGCAPEPRRIRVRNRWWAVRYELRRRRHVRAGHDAGCLRLGVPLGTIRRLLSDWDGAGAAGWLGEAITETVKDSGQAPVPIEEVRYAVRSRITPRAPQTSRLAPRSE